MRSRRRIKSLKTVGLAMKVKVLCILLGSLLMLSAFLPLAHAQKYFFTVHCATTELRLAYAEVIKENMAELGINVELDVMEWAATDELRRSPLTYEEGGWDMMVLGNEIEPDPGGMIEYFQSSSWPPTGENYGRYSNGKVDSLFKEADLTANLTEQTAIYNELFSILYDEQPFVWFYQVEALLLFRKEVSGIEELTAWRPVVSDPPFDAQNITVEGTDTFIFAEYFWYPNFNPTFFNYLTGLYGTLVRLNPDFEIVPELAESWDISSDLMTFTLHLRPDVKWHDGENFTSADVKYTMEAWLDPNVGSALYGIFEPLIDTIDTPDAHTVIVNLLKPSSSFMFHLTKATKAEILPKHIWESIPPLDWRTSDYNTGAQKPIGTGPWMFVEVTADSFKFEKNPNYYIPGVPKMDYIIYKRIPEASTALAALQNGEVHMCDFFYHYEDQFETLKDDPDLQWSKVFRFDVEAIEFNLNHPILSSKWVRQAFAYAFPRETYVQEVMAGFGIPTSIPLPDGHWATPPGYEIYEYDLEAAADVLELAGFMQEYLEEEALEIPWTTIATYVVVGAIVGGVVVGAIFMLRKRTS